MRRAVLACALLAGIGTTGAAQAQLLSDLPEQMQGVGIDDKSGAQIPLDLRFRDENGRAITLADVFDGDRPVLLSLNYSDCPMLCGLQLNGLVQSLQDLKLSAGKDFDVVSVSVDPLETTSRAKLTEQKYLKQYARGGAAGGFRFLTGNNDNIRALADAIGFRYKYLPDRKEYSHTAAEIVCTPDGVVSRYLYGVMYDPQTLRLSLVEASDGKIGSPLDQLILYCFHYDETEGRYGPVARRVMSVGAGITVVALAAGLLPYWLHRSSPPAPDPAGEADAVAASSPSTPPGEPAPHSDAHSDAHNA
ncbi:MAG: SCO family protein [Botrimarina sp.]